MKSFFRTVSETSDYTEGQHVSVRLMGATATLPCLDPRSTGQFYVETRLRCSTLGARYEYVFSDF